MRIEAIDAGDLEALADERQPGMAGEGAPTGAEFDVGHGAVRVSGDIGYIAMRVSGLEDFQGAGLTDSGGISTTLVDLTLLAPALFLGM